MDKKRDLEKQTTTGVVESKFNLNLILSDEEEI